MHVGFVEYVRNRKIALAQHLLLHTDLSILSISEKTGFNTPNTFFKSFKSITGLTPHEFRMTHLDK